MRLLEGGSRPLTACFQQLLHCFARLSSEYGEFGRTHHHACSRRRTRNRLPASTALYLKLAIREGASIATRDAALARAAREDGVEVV
jgi:predicted nucleic acid-binding protein